MNTTEIRNQDPAKLIELLAKTQKEYIEKKVMIGIGKEKNTASVKQLKKDIARIQTVIRQKEILNEN